MISLKNIRKSYDDGATFAVDDVSLEIKAGEFIVLLGESGCGKTTLLKMINRLNDLTSGTIEIEGENVLDKDPVQLRRHIGYVFQEVGLFPHMTVAENVATVPKLLKWKPDDIGVRVEELLEMVKIPAEKFGNRRSSELSGGQRQRIGLARALAGKPKIMLMDEPFGALDPLNRDLLQREFHELHKQLGLTTVMVTHDMMEALLLADRIAVMIGGKLVQAGTPQELMESPADDFVERMISTPKRQAVQLEAIAQGRRPA